MFCSCSRLPAIREVVFKDMLRMRSSTFRVFRACEEASGERGGAEDFSLTRGISAAELTHIDHERKRMTRYFKPLLAEVTKNQSFSHFLCHCITDSFLPIDIQLVWLVIYARFLYYYSITTLSLATWMENRHSAYTYLYINILQIKTNNKHQIPISANHSIILCKNGYKIGKTEWFSFSGTEL